MNTGRLWVYRQVTRWLPETRCFGIKVAILRWCGVKIGRNVRICSSALLWGAGRMEIGDNVWIGPLVAIEASGDAVVRIGNNVDIANGVMITTGTHDIDLKGPHVAGRGNNKSVEIGDGAWICLCARILPGTLIGGHSVVAAGSVVTHACNEANVLLAGVPAKVVKHYSTEP